jgi:hypothetical protein
MRANARRRASVADPPVRAVTYCSGIHFSKCVKDPRENKIVQ